MPLVYFSGTVIPVRNGEEAWKDISRSDFNPQQLILEGDVIQTKSGGHGIFHLRTIEKRTNHASYSVDSDQDGYLVFVENFYPGWKVQVDGREVPVYRANYLFSAIHLKAGKHLVERGYFPRSLKLGFIISFVSAVFLGLILVRITSRLRASR